MGFVNINNKSTIRIIQEKKRKDKSAIFRTKGETQSQDSRVLKITNMNSLLIDLEILSELNKCLEN